MHYLRNLKRKTWIKIVVSKMQVKKQTSSQIEVFKLCLLYSNFLSDSFITRRLRILLLYLRIILLHVFYIYNQMAEDIF